jgi:hypothetical protein
VVPRTRLHGFHVLQLCVTTTSGARRIAAPDAKMMVAGVALAVLAVTIECDEADFQGVV